MSDDVRMRLYVYPSGRIDSLGPEMETNAVVLMTEDYEFLLTVRDDWHGQADALLVEAQRLTAEKKSLCLQAAGLLEDVKQLRAEVERLEKVLNGAVKKLIGYELAKAARVPWRESFTGGEK